MTEVRLREIGEQLARAVISPDPDRGASVEGRLLSLRGDQWLRLDEMSRRYALHSDSPWAQITTWQVTQPAVDAVVAVAASMSRTGGCGNGHWDGWAGSAVRWSRPRWPCGWTTGFPGWRRPRSTSSQD